MAKKILILNGSPRKNGNTTALIEAFANGAKENGNTVTEFRISEMNIHPCKACEGGGENPDRPCVQKDDMDKIYPVYNAADILVLASPEYWGTISGQLKYTIDRLYAIYEPFPRLNPPKKESILIMTAGGNGFELATQWYDEVLIKGLGWKDLGKILCGGVRDIGTIKGNPKLEEAKKLGQSIK
jgi:multimeric flavodoxin WrbA